MRKRELVSKKFLLVKNFGASSTAHETLREMLVFEVAVQNPQQVSKVNSLWSNRRMQAREVGILDA